MFASFLSPASRTRFWTRFVPGAHAPGYSSIAASRLRAIAFAAAILVPLTAVIAHARVLMTQEQALAAAFPAPAKVTREKFFLTPRQIAAAKSESGVEFNDQLIVRYASRNTSNDGRYAYFDSHRVRTMPETIMVVVKGDAIERIDILSFDEPTDYFPKPRWIDQLRGRKLDRELALNRAIRPISGASLTGRAIVDASRKILAIHHVLAGVTPR